MLRRRRSSRKGSALIPSKEGAGRRCRGRFSPRRHRSSSSGRSGGRGGSRHPLLRWERMMLLHGGGGSIASRRLDLVPRRRMRGDRSVRVATAAAIECPGRLRLLLLLLLSSSRCASTIEPSAPPFPIGETPQRSVDERSGGGRHERQRRSGRHEGKVILVGVGVIFFVARTHPASAGGSRCVAAR